MPTVYTIGHSTHAIERLIELLQQHDISAVADVRSYAHSRYNPQFNEAPLKEVLKQCGIAYVFLGRELGARPQDAACYAGGRVHYARLARTEFFRDGLRRVIDGANHYRLALLCAEKEPLACHRSLLIARELQKCNVEVVHIHPDGRLEPNGKAMDRLLELVGLSDQKDLFKDRDELIADACAIQEEKIAYVDEGARGASYNEDLHDRVH